jgi:hypothetical protein
VNAQYGNAGGFSKREFGPMFADQREIASGTYQDAPDELSEFPVADHDNPVSRIDLDMFQNAACSGKRLCEYGLRIGNSVRYREQVLRGQAQVIRKGTVAIVDAQYSPARAVPGISLMAQVAVPATGVDLPDHPASDLPRLGRALDDADELMT